MRARYRVVEFAFPTLKPLRLPFMFLRQMFQLLWYGTRAEAIICMFAGYHSLLPALFGRIAGIPVVIMPGGADSNTLDEVGYGNYRKPLMAWATRRSLHMARAIAPVHERLVNTINDYVDPPRPQGFAYYCPHLKVPIVPIHNGYDTRLFQDLGTERPPASFLTLATRLDNPVRTAIKGVDLVIEAARAMPHCKFTLLGASGEIKDIPPNCTVLPHVPNAQLVQHYNRHTFYLQLSMTEGFPNALAEAMLCGCIPITSTVGAMPDMVGDAGYLLAKREVIQLIALLNTSLSQPTEPLRKMARNQIASRFTLEARQTALFKLMEGLRNNSAPVASHL